MARSAARQLCRIASSVCVLIGATIALGMVVEARAAVRDVGTATVVSPPQGGSSRAPLMSGSRDTVFSLQLPDGAACSGDSAHDEYRVQSFMVPAAVDPRTLTFDASGPTPVGMGTSFRQPLFERNSRPFVDAMTDIAAKAGEPGVIINIPSFDLELFSDADLPPGHYLVGIACTKGGPGPSQLDRIWATAFDISAPSVGGATGWTAPQSAAAQTASGSDTATAASVEAADADAASGAESAVTPVDAASADAEATATSDSVAPSGGAPSFTLPAIELTSRMTVADSPTTSIVLWFALALALTRLAMLLARRPAIEPAV